MNRQSSELVCVSQKILYDLHHVLSNMLDEKMDVPIYVFWHRLLSPNTISMLHSLPLLVYYSLFEI